MRSDGPKLTMDPPFSFASDAREAAINGKIDGCNIFGLIGNEEQCRIRDVVRLTVL